MVTAVDTNVLLDVFLDDPTYRQSSYDALTRDKGFYRDYFQDLRIVDPSADK